MTNLESVKPTNWGAFDRCHTPAFILSERELVAAATRLRQTCISADCLLLYSVKALALPCVLQQIQTTVDGFSVSSPFEARVVREATCSSIALHATTPYFQAELFDSLLRKDDFISFNSLSQQEYQAPRLSSGPTIGLRLNPNLPLVTDSRYDPCRRHSKLGVHLDEFQTEWMKGSLGAARLEGLHFHTNCEGRDFAQLFKTVSHVSDRCGHILDELKWFNLGGGYLFRPEDPRDDFFAAVDLLRKRHNLTVFVEPGAAFVREVGYLVASVVDQFSRDGKQVAVLDTTVNHMPEVFEYQFSPEVLGGHDNGKHRYILAGCSCLAGDLFGEYGFDEPLSIGSRVVFANVGDYTTTKWHYFNGINLPSIYMLTENSELVLVKEFTYEEFAERNGVATNVAVRT